MPANVADALSFIVGSIGQLYAFVLILRLMLPWFRADFRNPLARRSPHFAPRAKRVIFMFMQAG